MKVLVTEPLEQGGMDILRQHAQVDIRKNPTSVELLAMIGEYDALVVRSRTQVTRQILETCSKLKVVGRAGTGVDNIDVDAATAQGVIVVNAPAGNSNAVAEQTIAMMLMLARRLFQAVSSLKAGRWEKSSLQGCEVKGKVLGLVGLGRIGSLVASKAKGMEMRVVAFDPYASPERAATSGIELLALDEVLRISDFCSVHTPLTPDTHGLIDAAKLALMKPTAYILNCARGGIVDELALKNALAARVIAGAALDVFEVEPVTDAELIASPSLIATPHLGASTIEAQESVSLDVAQAVVDVLEGRMPASPVNLPYMPPKMASFILPYVDLAQRMGSFFIQWRGGLQSKIELVFEGDLNDCDTRVLTAAFLAGLLKSVSAAPINIVNALVYAQQRGLVVSEVRDGQPGQHNNVISAHFPDAEDANISGAIIQGEPHLVTLDSRRLDAVLQGRMLVDIHEDRPGFVGRIGQMLGSANINIAFAQLSRASRGGQSIMILGLDDEVPQELMSSVLQLPGVNRVRMVNLPELDGYYTK
jgi:D-3-phosphoglycerate dehydrogenase / 2-oxoglutarate reductase